jgi:two-component system, NtrC family, response regulator AtoC
MRENRAMNSNSSDTERAGSPLIGSHPLMGTVRSQIARIARSNVQFVLVYGETGTGKGIVVRQIHDLSARSKAPFVNVNCAAIPGNLMESELFGHAKGAFTGATANKQGLLSAANDGTLFLDEIPELELPLQAKLLTVLDTHQFRAVGSVRPLDANVRFIAATNKVLFHEVREKRFREDLYYRLLVVAINIPPLRDRGDDVLELTEHFLAHFSNRHGRVIRRIEPAAREIFRTFRWPGNVRQLQNVIERIFLLEDENEILVRHIPPRILLELNADQRAPAALFDEVAYAAGEFEPRGQLLDFHSEVSRLQRTLLMRAFSEAAGNIAEAANRLNLSRHAFRHHWAKLGTSGTARERKRIRS